MTTTPGPDGTQYVAVVDISRHQGVVSFATMRARGVSDLIIRVTNGVTVDTRAGEYIRAARDAGFDDDHLAYYTFLNPKAATADVCARKTVDTIHSLTGRTDVGLMDDIESYVAEGGNLPYIQGARFADWIRTFNATAAHEAPDSYLFGYTNRSYWDGNAQSVTGVSGPWVGDAALAAEMEWIVPRYPVYPPASVQADPRKLAAWILTSSKPPSPGDWAQWAYSKATGPFPPAGGKTSGWQFSAGWNRQGPVYGCQSSDLDLNIVRVEAWARWTQPDTTIPPPPPPPEEEVDMLRKVLVPTMSENPGWWPWLACFDSGTVRPLGPEDTVPVGGQMNISDVGQYRRMCAWAGIQLEVEQPKCADGGDVTVEVEGAPLPVLKLSGTIGPA